jgi:hypothetical protein
MLSVPLADGPRPLSLLGQSEPLAKLGDETLAVTLVTVRSRTEDAERDRLRGWLTHLALAASGAGAGQKLVSLVLGASRDGAAQVKRTVFPALPRDEAAARLSDLTADLLGGVHAYFLPCEGVFTWRRRQRNGEAMTLPQAIMLVRDDGFSRLASDRGPVADSRRYPVPAESEAKARVTRRFGGYFDATEETA